MAADRRRNDIILIGRLAAAGGRWCATVYAESEEDCGY